MAFFLLNSSILIFSSRILQILQFFAKKCNEVCLWQFYSIQFSLVYYLSFKDVINICLFKNYKINSLLFEP